MNHHSPMSAVTDHTARAICDAWVIALQGPHDDEGALRANVAEAAYELAQYADDNLLDKRETFTAIENAANKTGLAPRTEIRGILTAIAPDLYIPAPVIAPIGGDIEDGELEFFTDARRKMATTHNGDRLPMFQAIAIEAGALVGTDEISRPDVADFLHELAQSSGLADELRQDELQHLLSEAMQGRVAVSGVVRAKTPALARRPAPDIGGPIPLVAELAPSEPYPVKALGPVLSLGALAIARKIQAPIEMAAQSVLAVAALAAQSHADVQLPFGQTRPLSVALITVASSGDRKTSTDREAAWPLRTRENELGANYAADLETHRINIATWEAEKKRIEGEKKLTRDARRLMLEDLGPAPLAPLFPFMTAPEPTIEGLIKAMPRALASLGLFSAEGGQFVGGHGMSTDNRLKTAAALSSLWDGDVIKRIRAGDGVSIIKGRRLSVHMMIQPDVAATFLTDPLLRDQGLLSRILVAAPCTLAGTRTYQETTAHDDAAIKAYGVHILRLLNAPWPLMPNTDNELSPRVLPMSADAATLWREFHDETERQIGPGGRLAPVRDFAGKAAEHVARIAGVLAIVGDVHAEEISAHNMLDAVELVRWHLGEALRLCAASMTDPAARRAVRLLEWLRTNHPAPNTFGIRDIVRLGPAELRNKAPAETAVRKLVEHGYVREASAKPLKWALVDHEADASVPDTIAAAKARGDAW